MQRILSGIMAIFVLGIVGNAYCENSTIKIDAELWINSQKEMSPQIIVNEFSKASVEVNNLRLTVRPILKCADQIFLIFEIFKNNALQAEPTFLAPLGTTSIIDIIDELGGNSIKLSAQASLVKNDR